MTNHNEIILYQLNEDIKLEVKLEEETVWLTQAQMTILFETTKQNISLHINNIFKERELDRNSVVKEYFTTALDGKNYLTRYYNLDVIISVGYRVKSLRGTYFRIVLKRGCLQLCCYYYFSFCKDSIFFVHDYCQNLWMEDQYIFTIQNIIRCPSL